MSEEIRYFKLDEDDILEILIEYLQDQYSSYDCAKGVILGEPGNDLRFVAAIGVNCDESIKNIKLNRIDKIIEYNGSHAFLKRHPEANINTSSRTGNSSILFDISQE